MNATTDWPGDEDMSPGDEAYLWDGSGEPAADIRRIEALLAPLKHRATAPRLAGAIERRPRRTARAAWHAWTVAAALALAILAPWIAVRLAPAPTTWRVAWLDGSAPDGDRSDLAVGGALDTGTRRARLDVGAIGTVNLEPGTRVRLVDAGATHHRLALDRGTMHAVIWAPPGQFLVDTPSALAVDLGCRYTLEITDDGSGVLRVEVGWVGFAHEGRRVLVPAGALAETRPVTGPGTPYLDDATPVLVQALRVIDFGADRGAGRTAALDSVLAAAREVDALTLWHLLGSVERGERARVFDRFAQLVAPPPGVSREGIVGGDAAMLDAWWNVLGLGATEDWREWTSPWPGGTPAGTR